MDLTTHVSYELGIEQYTFNYELANLDLLNMNHEIVVLHRTT